MTIQRGASDPGQPDGSPSGLSLREIAQTLSTPARSGIVLTKERLGMIAARLDAPLGFGERAQMLMGLFRAAAELDRLPQLLAALADEVERWEVRYRRWSREYPRSATIWVEWNERLAATRTLLDEMARTVAEAQSSPPSAAAGPLPASHETPPDYED